jgi:hypothetical protein
MVFVTVLKFMLEIGLNLTVCIYRGAEFHIVSDGIWASAGPDKNEIQCKNKQPPSIN